MRHSVGSFALLVATALSAPAFAAVTPNHVYALDGSLADALGGPALTLQGSSALGATGVAMTGASGSHSGLVLANADTAFTNAGIFSIELFWTPDSVASYRRILNFDGSDNGVYVRDGQLNYYQAGGTSGTSSFANGSPLHVVVARDLSGTSLYLNGALELTVPAYSSSALSTTQPLRFFIDDLAEESAGFVDYIHTYDYKLSAGDVAALWSGDTGAVPEPASWALMIGGFALAGGAMRRRARTAVAFA